jgi:Fe-S-cluster containining protein
MYDPDKEPIPVPKSGKPEEILKVCQDCRGTCCTYMAVELDEPTTLEEFDDLRWYCAHKDVWVFKDDGDWYVVFNAVCGKLQDDASCGIYEERPQVCRDHKFGECDYYMRGEFDLELRSLEEVDAYIHKRFPTHARKKRLEEKKKRKLHIVGARRG